MICVKKFILLILVVFLVFFVCYGKVIVQNMLVGDKVRWVGNFVGIDQLLIGVFMYDVGVYFVFKVGVQVVGIILGGMLQGIKDFMVGWVVDVVFDYFLDVYNKFGVGKWNSIMLCDYQSQLGGLIFSKMDFVGMIYDIIRFGGVCMLMFLIKDFKVNKDCYEDVMDVLDVVNEMQRSDLVWVRVSK